MQCSDIRVWKVKRRGKCRRAELRAHLRFIIINLVATVSTVVFVQRVKAGQNQGFYQVVGSSGNDRLYIRA